MEDDISAYEYSKIRVRKCSALSQSYDILYFFVYCTLNILFQFWQVDLTRRNVTFSWHFYEMFMSWPDFTKSAVILKGTVQRDFLSPIFSLMESSQAPYSVFKDFSNLASNSVRYSRLLIDSPQYFIAESPYSLYCLLRRVVTLRIILAGSHHLLEFSA